MKKFLFLVSLVSIFSLFSCKDNKELVIFTNAEFPPFEYMKGQEIVGVDADIAAEIGKVLNKKVVIQNIEFGSIIPAVQSGKADMSLAGMTVTEERKKQVDFSIPYAESVQYIISFADAPVTDLASLADKRVGVQAGTTGHILMDDAIANNTIQNIKLSAFTNASIAVQELTTDRLDAVVIDKLPAQVIAKKNDKLVLHEVTTTTERYAACVKKGNTELLTTVNEVIKELLESGKIDEFILKHTVEF